MAAWHRPDRILFRALVPLRSPIHAVDRSPGREPELHHRTNCAPRPSAGLVAQETAMFTASSATDSGRCS